MLPLGDLTTPNTASIGDIYVNERLFDEFETSYYSDTRVLDDDFELHFGGSDNDILAEGSDVLPALQELSFLVRRYVWLILSEVSKYHARSR